MDSLLPLSENLLNEIGYKEYFTTKRHGQSLFNIMKTLALHGPLTNYELTSILIQRKMSDRDAKRPQHLTKPAKSEQAQIYRLLKQLRDNQLVNISGTTQGKIQKNVNLYGLTDLGLLLTCLVDEAVYADAETILRNYEPYEEKSKVYSLIKVSIACLFPTCILGTST